MWVGIIQLVEELYRTKSGGLPGGSVVKNLPAYVGDSGDAGLVSEMGRAPGGGNGNPLHIFAWEIPGQRSLAGYSPWSYKELSHD